MGCQEIGGERKYKRTRPKKRELHELPYTEMVKSETFSLSVNLLIKYFRLQTLLWKCYFHTSIDFKQIRIKKDKGKYVTYTVPVVLLFMLKLVLLYSTVQPWRILNILNSAYKVDFFLTLPPSPHMQFMSSEHADVYERGELDQDSGGDQDVDVRLAQ